MSQQTDNAAAIIVIIDDIEALLVQIAGTDLENMRIDNQDAILLKLTAAKSQILGAADDAGV
jgi:hypothetical protein